ncbi:PsbP-like protein 1 [Pycnococcus provasolii]|uniref:PsbP-like protein 1 n=1 Tax=Pycnococcus provasolii TaxID=41880 RepID=A0A830I0P8_9CHLO|nr:PsbP-like protein 1 [Pycnococcus provasolii]
MSVSNCAVRGRVAHKSCTHSFKKSRRHNLASALASHDASSSSRSASSKQPAVVQMDRRAFSIMLSSVPLSISSLVTPAAAFAKTPSGFTVKKDLQDGYEFLYPFGWTEVEVQGQDTVYKDVIEPLESVSVNVIPTQTERLSDIGSPEDVGKQLLSKVLTSPSQSPKLVGAGVRQDKDGNDYYTIEYLTKAPNYIRHGLTVIAIKNGKFFICNTGSNEKRWDAMKDKLKVVVNSFTLVPALSGAVGATIPTF